MKFSIPQAQRSRQSATLRLLLAGLAGALAMSAACAQQYGEHERGAPSGFHRNHASNSHHRQDAADNYQRDSSQYEDQKQRGRDTRYDNGRDAGRYARQYRHPYNYSRPVYAPAPVYYRPRQSPGMRMFFPLDVRR